MDKIEKARLEQLERCIPNIWKNKPSILYIGAYENRFHFDERMKEKGCSVYVVEVDKSACLWLKRNYSGGFVKEVICSDIRDWKLHLNYDIILWSHGVEVLPREWGVHELGRLSEHTRLFVNMTPHGDAGGTGNISRWFPDDFELFGYKTDTLGSNGERNSNLLAWKYL